MKVLEERRKDKELKEKLLKKAEKLNGKPHIMFCEKCGSKLEIREEEFKIEEDGFYAYTCPVCGRWVVLYWIEKWFGRVRKVLSDLFKKKEE